VCVCVCVCMYVCVCVPVPEISLMAAVSFYLMEGRRRAGGRYIYGEECREMTRERERESTGKSGGDAEYHRGRTERARREEAGRASPPPQRLSRHTVDVSGRRLFGGYSEDAAYRST